MHEATQALVCQTYVTVSTKLALNWRLTQMAPHIATENSIYTKRSCFIVKFIKCWTVGPGSIVPIYNGEFPFSVGCTKPYTKNWEAWGLPSCPSEGTWFNGLCPHWQCLRVTKSNSYPGYKQVRDSEYLITTREEGGLINILFLPPQSTALHH